VKPPIADSLKAETSVQQTNLMPPIALPTEIVHLESLRADTTPDNGQRAFPEMTEACAKLPPIMDKHWNCKQKF
jgi:hypothetical protein